MQKLIDKLEQDIEDLTHNKKFCVAYSGGLDSHVLLDMLVKLHRNHPDWQLRVIHINHGLSTHANLWQHHCVAICRQYQIPSQVFTPTIQHQPRQSLEAAARLVRYQLLGQHLGDGEYCLTAHHQDDQAETMLLQLLRGVGVQGLAAMPNLTAFASGYLFRPLLSTSRQQLQDYAETHQLNWVDDDSNQHMRFDRNYLRHQVMPSLQQRWPQFNKLMTRSAKHCAEAMHLLADYGCQDLAHVSVEHGCLAIKKLVALSAPRQRHVLRLWIQQQGFQLPSQAVLEQLRRDFLYSRHDRVPVLQWGQCEVRRFQYNLYIMPCLLPIEHQYVRSWQEDQSTLDLPAQVGTLKLRSVSGRGLAKRFVDDKLTVRFRQGGEVCRLPGRETHHVLKKLWQEWQVPPWQRQRIPLVFHGDQLAVVVDYCVCEPFVAAHSEPGVEFYCERENYDKSE